MFVPSSAVVVGQRSDGTTIFSETNTTNLIFENGFINYGPLLPEDMSSHCMVLLHTGDIMIMTGVMVWKFNHLTKEYNRMENMPYYMRNSGCSLFHSPTHGNRPVVFIGGGSKGLKAIVLDYTRSTTWEERELCYQMLIVLVN